MSPITSLICASREHRSLVCPQGARGGGLGIQARIKWDSCETQAQALGRQSQGFRNSLNPSLLRNYQDGPPAYGAKAESLCRGQERARRRAHGLLVSLI